MLDIVRNNLLDVDIQLNIWLDLRRDKANNSASRTYATRNTVSITVVRGVGGQDSSLTTDLIDRFLKTVHWQQAKIVHGAYLLFFMT